LVDPNESIKQVEMTVYIARHCELAKQSRKLSCLWIASQARNDVKQVFVIGRTRWKHQTGENDGYVHTLACTRHCELPLAARNEAESRNMRSIWIASQARNDVRQDFVISRLQWKHETGENGVWSLHP